VPRCNPAGDKAAKYLQRIKVSSRLGVQSLLLLIGCLQIMTKKPRQCTKPTWIRTLGLPRDFQLVAGRRDVRKADAQSGFLVRHREYSGFRMGVAKVSHTLKAFVRYILYRFQKWYREFFLGVVENLLPSQPVYGSTVLFPSLSSVRAATTLALRTGLTCVRSTWNYVVARAWEEMIVLPRFPEPQVPVVIQPQAHRRGCPCSACMQSSLDGFYRDHIVRMYELGHLVWVPEGRR